MPQQILSGVRLHMGHFSVTILTSTGSVLSDIQQFKLPLTLKTTAGSGCQSQQQK
ncbi:MAG: hypothetical protein ACI8Q6_003847 [Granulosicoccus sp.]